MIRIQAPLLRFDNKNTGGNKHNGKRNDDKLTGEAVSQKQSRAESGDHKSFGRPFSPHATHLLLHVCPKKPRLRRSAFSRVKYVYVLPYWHYTPQKKKRYSGFIIPGLKIPDLFIHPNIAVVPLR